MATGAAKVSSERGAIIIQVLVAFLVLTAFLMFVVDYGVKWVSRSQAQASADAGALAGAVALAFDDFDDHSITGPAKASAHQFALVNTVFGQAPVVDITSDIKFYDDDPSKFPAFCSDDTCIRVDVFRNQTRGNPLPVWFGSLVGLSSQGVWATATARATPTNAAQCLRPWAVADKWTEGNGDPWTQSSVFDPSQGDTYDPDQGFSRMDANGDPVDLGYQLTLKLFNPGAGETYVMSSGWTMKLDLPNANTPQYPNNISGCTSITVPFADPNSNCTVEDPEAGCVGVLTGSSTGQDNMGITDLIAQDQGATWDRVNNRVNTTMGTSPRVVPVAVFDTGLYVSQGYNGTNGVVKVVNILGFFVEGFCNDLAPSQRESYLQCTTNGPERDIVGRLVSFSGTAVPTGPAAGPGAFGQLITLVR